MAAGFAPPVSKKGASDIDPADASTIAPTSVMGEGPFPHYGATPTELKGVSIGVLQNIRIQRERTDREIYDLAVEAALSSKEWDDWITIDKPGDASMSTTDKEQKSN